MPDLSLRTRDARGRLLPVAEKRTPDFKTCRRCKVSRPSHRFAPDLRRSDLLASHCNDCKSQEMRDKRENDPDLWRSKDRAEKRRKKRNARLRERRRTDPAWRAKQSARRILSYQLRKCGITTDDLFVRDLGICHLCERPVERAVAEPDHVIPLARGGANEAWNVKLAHRNCNRRKQDKIGWKPPQEEAPAP